VNQKETKMEGRVDYRIYKAFFHSIGLFWTVVLAIGTFLTLAAEFAVPYMLAQWINEGNSENFGFFSTNYLLFGVLSLLAQLVNAFAPRFMVLNAANYFHEAGMKAIQNTDLQFFETRHSGQIVQRFVGDISSLEWSSYSIVEVVLYVPGLIATIVLISLSSWISFVPIPLCILLCYRIYQQYAPALVDAMRLRPLSRSSTTSTLQDLMAGERVWKCDNADMILKLFFPSAEREMASYLFAEAVFAWYDVRASILSALLILIVSIVNAQVAVSGSNFNAFNALSITYSLQFMAFLQFSLGAAASFESTMASVERLQEYVDEAKPEAPRLLPTDPPRQAWPTQGKIVFNDVTVAYPSAPTLPILKSISLQINGSEKLGVVGRTGAGKSTFVSLLFRMLDNYQGTITIDGVDIKSLGLETLRTRLFIILQDPVLFQGTLRSNLDPEGIYADSDLWEVLGQCQLKAHVTSMEGSLDAEVTEKGSGLSQGQKQLFMIAKALLKKPKIIVLDESTSSMDDGSDETIQKVIKDAFKESTVITIAHRLSTIIDYDRVLILNQGTVAALDSPSRLLEDPESEFTQMAIAAGEAQFQTLRQQAK
jgi:ABC-type multidrug transport system fused ATPase/permease subunit